MYSTNSENAQEEEANQLDLDATENLELIKFFMRCKMCFGHDKSDQSQLVHLDRFLTLCENRIWHLCWIVEMFMSIAIDAN